MPGEKAQQESKSASMALLSALLLALAAAAVVGVSASEDSPSFQAGNVIWNPGSVKVKREIYDFEVAGITIKKAWCEEKACTERIYGVPYLPDLFVYIDYGEYDDLGLGSRHRVGFFGKTPQVRKASTADFGAATFRYVRSNGTHQYRIRTNGYFDVQLYDGDRSFLKPNFLGYTHVNVTDFGPQERLLTGMSAAYVSFDVFGALTPLART